MKKHAFFDQVAVSSDPLLFTPEDRAKVSALHQRLGNLAGLRVLEPGCGAGPLTEHLAEWVGPSGQVLAFDASLGMVEQCRLRVAGVRSVQILQAEAETVELAPGAWDRVILFRVFPHFDDKAGILRRLKPCLAPGGKLVIANLEGSQKLNALHASFSEPVRHDHMPCRIGTRRLLEECGFQVERAVDADDEFFVSAIAADSAR